MQKITIKYKTMNPQLKQKLSALFTICMNGNVDFQYDASCSTVYVMEIDKDANEWDFYERLCFQNAEDISLLTIKVKNYISRKLENELKQALEVEKAGLTN